jgi:hypothetical protein
MTKDIKMSYYYQCLNSKCSLHTMIHVYEFALDSVDEFCPECDTRFERPTVEYLKMYGMI